MICCSYSLVTSVILLSLNLRTRSSSASFFSLARVILYPTLFEEAAKVLNESSLTKRSNGFFFKFFFLWSWKANLIFVWWIHWFFSDRRDFGWTQSCSIFYWSIASVILRKHKEWGFVNRALQLNKFTRWVHVNSSCQCLCIRIRHYLLLKTFSLSH